MPGRWSHHRWRRTFIALFLLQLGFLWFLSDRLPSKKQVPDTMGRLSLIDDARFEAPMNEVLRLMDPTLFAFAHSHGFSGEAWMNAKQPEHRLDEKTIPMQPLEAIPAFFGQSSLAIPKDTPPYGRLGADKSEVRLMDIPITQAPIFPQSQLEVEPSLSQRFIPLSTPLPSWPAKEMLTNSTVQVAVDAAGDVILARLGPGCGLAEADGYALNHAKELHFQPSNPTAAIGQEIFNRMPLAWGRLVYHWATTVSATATNQKANP